MPLPVSRTERYDERTQIDHEDDQSDGAPEITPIRSLAGHAVWLTTVIRSSHASTTTVNRAKYTRLSRWATASSYPIFRVGVR